MEISLSILFVEVHLCECRIGTRADLRSRTHSGILYAQRIIYVSWWHRPLDVRQSIPIRKKQAEHLLAFLWMTTAGLLVAYRGKNEHEVEISHVSICLDEDRIRNKASFKRRVKAGSCSDRLSASEQSSMVVRFGDPFPSILLQLPMLAQIIRFCTTDG